MTTYPMQWAFAYGQPASVANFRVQPEDFFVDEELGFELSGHGEHIYLRVEKRGDNSSWVAAQIARLAGVDKNDVGYCGLKDRHAVTRQWFSVYLPKGEAPNWQELPGDSLTVLEVSRHERKLRRGDHQRNHFVIRLRDVVGDRSDLERRLAGVAVTGVPNYFGPQRFGIDGGNLQQAQELLVEGKRIKHQQQRSMALSAARSYLFNEVLSERVKAGDWHQLLAGDPGVDGVASGPLWGRGRPLSSGALAEREAACLEGWAEWRNGLEHVGLGQERRALCLNPENFAATWLEDDLQLSFALGAGAFATAILREICELKSVSDGADMV